MYGIARFTQMHRSTGLLYEIDTRVKIIILLCLSVFSILLENPVSLLAMLFISTALAVGARIDAGRIGLLAFLVVLTTWGTMFSQTLFYDQLPRTVWFQIIEKNTPVIGRLIGELNVYHEGFRHGAIQSLRFSFMLIGGLVFVWTTDSTGMLRGLLNLRVPYTLAFMTVMAVRFLPTIIDETFTVMRAFKLRGGDMFSINPVATVLNCLTVIRPVLINCYRRSNILASSIQSRAFDPGAKRHGRLGKPLSSSEIIILVAALTVTTTLVSAKIVYWLYLSGFNYQPALRPLYEFCRLYI